MKGEGNKYSAAYLAPWPYDAYLTGKDGEKAAGSPVMLC